MELFKNSIGIPPILLLDDVFEKLDESRMAHLLDQVCNNLLGKYLLLIRMPIELKKN